MLDRLKSIEERYEKLNEYLSDPEVVNDPKKLREYSKEQSDIQETVEVYRQYRAAYDQLNDAKAMLEEKLDAEMRDMVKEEISELTEETERLEDELKILLIPKDPNDDKNVIVEVRGAAGGEEAALLREIFTVCTAVMLKCKAGKRKSWKQVSLAQAVIKKSSL